jgi:hypothetical protein
MTSGPLVAITPSFPLLLQDGASPEVWSGSDRTDRRRRRVAVEPCAALAALRYERGREGTRYKQRSSRFEGVAHLEHISALLEGLEPKSGCPTTPGAGLRRARGSPLEPQRSSAFDQTHAQPKDIPTFNSTIKVVIQT